MRTKNITRNSNRFPALPDADAHTQKSVNAMARWLPRLAPRLRELFDTSSPYLWALAQDSKGNLYVAETDTGRRVQRFKPVN